MLRLVNALRLKLKIVARRDAADHENTASDHGLHCFAKPYLNS